MKLFEQLSLETCDAQVEMWALTLVVATGAFWFTTANRRPQTIAADTTGSISQLSVPIPAGLQSVNTDGGHHFGHVD